MRKATRGLFATLVLIASASVYADDSWESSPYNYSNSSYNYENSPYNYRNSPYNYENSRFNPNRQSVHDSDGESQGYVVPRSDGGFNIFSDDGERIGYVPRRRR